MSLQLLLVALASITLVQTRIDTVKVHIRNSTAARVLASLKAQRGLLPEGVTVVIAPGVDDVLAVNGTRGGIKRAEELIRLLDVKPRTGFIELSFKRLTRDAQGGSKVETLATQRIAITNEFPIHSSCNGGADVQLDFTPRINGDGSVSLSGNARLTGTGFDAPNRAPLRIAKRIEHGKTMRLVGDTNVSAIRDQVRVGDTAEPHSPGVILYVEATVPR